MSLLNNNVPGVALSVVWNVLRISYAAEDKNGPQGSFSSISIPSISAVRNGSLSVKRTLSIIPLDCGLNGVLFFFFMP
jgi:hypothetical protein